MLYLSYEFCLEYWDRFEKCYNKNEKFVYGIVGTKTGILPYIIRKDIFFDWEFNTFISIADGVYYLFKSLPSHEEFYISNKNLMLYLKQQSISQDFQ